MISKSVIKHVRALHLKKFREETGFFVVEGPKIIFELLRSKGWRVTNIYALPSWLPPAGIALPEITVVSEKELDQLSALKHPNKVLAVVEIPDIIQRKCDPPNSGLFLLLDHIQDPGNLGTIIRIADWFGLAGIFCSNDTVDCFNSKVVQASMGSIFRVPVVYCSLSELLIKNAEGPKLPVFGTQLDGQSIYKADIHTNAFIIMSNEGRGLNPVLKPFVNKGLLIPSKSNGNDSAESLNVAVATGIVCAEFARKMP